MASASEVKLSFEAPDHSNDSGGNSWADAARREWQVFGEGTARGFLQNGVGAYEKEPWKLVRDLGTIGAYQLAMRGPAWVRVPAMIGGAIGGVQFVVDAAPVGKEAVSKFRETAADPSSTAANKLWAENSLGPLSFELTTMAAAGAASRLGKFIPSINDRPAFARAYGAGVNDTVENIDASVIQPKKASAPSYGAETNRVSALLSSETNYSMLGKMERGTRGAYLIQDADGKRHIFKLVSPDDTSAQVSRTAQAASAVNSVGARTPQFERVKYTPGYGTWYVQELLDGKPAPYPSDKLIGQMVALNDKQAGAGISGMKDWNRTVMSVINDDSNGGIMRHISNQSAEGANFVNRVKTFVKESGAFEPQTGDVVHGDFQHYNALVSPSDRLTGYVDWEGAGRGDRSIDLSRLLYDAYVSEKEIGYKANPETLAMLTDKIRDNSGTAGLNSYMAYWMLQVANYGTHVGGDTAKMFMGVGNKIMDDLGRKEQVQQAA